MPAVGAALQLPGPGADVALQGGDAAPEPAQLVPGRRVALEAASLLLDLAQLASRSAVRSSVGGPTLESRMEIARPRSTAAKSSAGLPVRSATSSPSRASGSPCTAEAVRRSREPKPFW